MSLAVWIGEFIWWQRYPKCANQNPNNGICRWQQQNWLRRRLNWKETEWVSIYGAEVKGPQPASPPYQYYTKKLELAEKKQVWKKDSMTNGEAIFPKRPVKTTGFFSSVRQKKTYYYTFWQKFSLNFAASVYDIVSGLGNKSTKPE